MRFENHCVKKDVEDCQIQQEKDDNVALMRIITQFISQYRIKYLEQHDKRHGNFDIAVEKV